MKGMRPLTDTKINKVAHSFAGKHAARNKMLFVLGVSTGYRVSELLSLRVGDVYQHGRVVDQVTVRRAHMKGSREGRTVLLHASVRELLGEYLAGIEQRPEMPLFPSQKAPSEPISYPQAWRGLQAAFAANRLGMGLGSHTMRKSYARRQKELLHSDLTALQDALGHRHITTTMAYLSFDRAAVDAAAVGQAPVWL